MKPKHLDGLLVAGFMFAQQEKVEVWGRTIFIYTKGPEPMWKPEASPEFFLGMVRRGSLTVLDWTTTTTTTKKHQRDK